MKDKLLFAIVLTLVLSASAAQAAIMMPSPGDEGGGGGTTQESPINPLARTTRNGMTFEFQDDRWMFRDSTGDYTLHMTTIKEHAYWDVTMDADYPNGINGVRVLRDPRTGTTTYVRGENVLTGAELANFRKENSEALKSVEQRTAQQERPFDVLRAEKQTIFQNFVQYFRQYSGLAGWSSLIFDEEFLKDWRDTVNTIMCDTLHLPTKECWTSQICGHYAGIKPTKDGVLFSTAAGGVPRAVAHIEGQRSLPIVLPNETKWGYTVTFGLTNPDDEEVTYNVRFAGPRSSATWWNSPRKLGSGSTASAIGASALYKVSANDYGDVCLEFSQPIRGFDGTRIDEICNSISQYGGGATAPYPAESAATTQQGPAASGTGGTTAAELPPGANV